MAARASASEEVDLVKVISSNRNIRTTLRALNTKSLGTSHVRRPVLRTPWISAPVQNPCVPGDHRHIQLFWVGVLLSAGQIETL